MRNRANATKMENARAKQNMKNKHFGLWNEKAFSFGPQHGPNIRKPSFTKIRLRLSKFGYSFVGSLSVYVVHVIVVRLVLVLVFLVAACAPISNHCAILFQLYHLKNRPIFPFLLRCCSVLFFFYFIYCFFYSIFFPPLECYYGSFDLNCSNSMRSQHIRLDEIQNADM